VALATPHQSSAITAGSRLSAQRRLDYAKDKQVQDTYRTKRSRRVRDAQGKLMVRTFAEILCSLDIIIEQRGVESQCECCNITAIGSAWCSSGESAIDGPSTPGPDY